MSLEFVYTSLSFTLSHILHLALVRVDKGKEGGSSTARLKGRSPIFFSLKSCVVPIVGGLWTTSPDAHPGPRAQTLVHCMVVSVHGAAAVPTCDRTMVSSTSLSHQSQRRVTSWQFDMGVDRLVWTGMYEYIYIHTFSWRQKACVPPDVLVGR